MRTAATFLNAAASFPLASLSDLLGEGGGAVIVAPHPDDESLGCGALIAATRSAGRSLKIIVLSDGAGSHRHSATYPAPRLRALRKREVRDAANALGVGAQDVICLALPDGDVPSVGPEAEAAASRIAQELLRARSSALFVTWRHDPHCDHQAAHAIALRTAALRPETRLFEYAIWGHSLPPDTPVAETPRGWRLEASAYLALKRQAIACHRSQVTDLIGDDPTGFRLSEDVLARFDGGFEAFFELGA